MTLSPEIGIPSDGSPAYMSARAPIEAPTVRQHFQSLKGTQENL